MAEAATEAALPHLAPRGRGSGRRFLSFLSTLARRKPIGFFGLVVLVFMVVLALFPRVFATHSPAEAAGERFLSYCFGPSDTFLCPTQRQQDSLLPGGGLVKEGQLDAPLGTDQLGRDIYSRMIYGARVAMYVGLMAVLITSLIALAVGVTSAYFAGAYDAIVQRVVDAVMALPPLVILISLPTLIGRWDLTGPLDRVPGIPSFLLDRQGITNFKLIIILGILGGASGSRVIRSATIGVRSAQYVDAAVVLGASHGRIMIRHIVPNIFGPLMVQATIGLGGVILTEAALSFLGLGDTSPDRPSWGQMLQLGASVSSVQPMQAVYPGLGIALAVFSFNMLGDALRDLLDPRLRGARGGFN
ncbi:MAG: ABC transporter permease [Chloroflexi bacterium]|nr:ABC transporter permease [Chloroflexota bacterium]